MNVLHLAMNYIVKEIEVIHESVDYPITPKEHGTEFLMDHRHLWLTFDKTACGYENS